jgi:hypothetical protein
MPATTKQPSDNTSTVAPADQTAAVHPRRTAQQPA